MQASAYWRRQVGPLGHLGPRVGVLGPRRRQVAPLGPQEASVEVLGPQPPQAVLLGRLLLQAGGLALLHLAVSTAWWACYADSRHVTASAWAADVVTMPNACHEAILCAASCSKEKSTLLDIHDRNLRKAA